MSKYTSPFYDQELICTKQSEPINFASVQVEVKTFISLMASRLERVRVDYDLCKNMVMFFEAYDDAIKEITEIEKFESKQISWLRRLESRPTVAVDKERINKLLQSIMEGKRSIHDTIEHLQFELFSEMSKDDIQAFKKVLAEATDKIIEDTKYLHRLVLAD